MPQAQGTIASFDATTGGGTVLLDDGVRVSFAGEALADSRVRHLRPGQRVTLDLRDPAESASSTVSAGQDSPGGQDSAGEGPRIVRVRIVTLP